MTDGVDWLRVPDAVRQPVLPVEPPPEWINNFRFAKTADGLNDDGSPRISPERGYITDPAERERLLGYLSGGAVVVDNMARGPDLIDPTRQLAVPATFRTDGTWVWAGSVEYYLRWHNVAPEPELKARIERNGYSCPPVDPDTVGLARAATDNRAWLMHGRVEAYMAAHPELQPGDPSRFEADVNEALVGMGWTRDRALGSEVDDWLTQQLAQVAELDGQTPEAPFAAALAVMREFGGLISVDNGSGKTSAKVPFTIYPAESGELVEFAPDVQQLSQAIGKKAFQVGEVERGMGALVVDDTGRMFVVGPGQFYAGQTIDEALTRMLQGIRCEKLDEIQL